jgi:hypothetical protein
MNGKIERACETMSVEELQAELARLKDNLCDLEDTHSFTFGKTSVHIGAEQAQSMLEEYEEECRSETAVAAHHRGAPCDFVARCRNH